ncbi:MAG: hypothetical protein KZQ75_02105 [Candidatus Thiodiazotropha sp. (ex Myrtea spinifera)]|nr:hypothetical protein [Candidatus Thiodiazotropha sp. (ex Myrtea spinifera)]
MKKCLAMIFLICASINSFAAETVGPAIPISVDSGWSMGITIRGNYDNNQGCSNTKYIRYNKDSADYETAQSIILMAFAAQKKLKFSVNGCLGSFAKATWVEIVN